MIKQQIHQEVNAAAKVATNAATNEKANVNAKTHAQTEITLDEIIDHSPRKDNHQEIFGVITTRLNYDDATKKYFIKNPLVSGEQIVVSKSTIEITEVVIGNDVLVVFEENDIYRPIITGVIRGLEQPKISESSIKNNTDRFESNIDNKDRLVFSAEREIVLQCGKSSIHLTKEGKVVIRGTYVMSRSSGLNSIKGGSVSIN